MDGRPCGQVSDLSKEEEAGVCRSGGKSMSSVGKAGEAQGLCSGIESWWRCVLVPFKGLLETRGAEIQ